MTYNKGQFDIIQSKDPQIFWSVMMNLNIEFT